MAVEPIYPLELLVLQLNSFCNISCKYCYLNLTERNTHKVMSERTITKAITDAASYPSRDEGFGILLHAGEPLSAPIGIYEKIAQTAKDVFGPEKQPLLLIQTNGTLISPEWCDLFEKFNFRIGISLDGPQALHDMKRVRRSGGGTYNEVMSGIELLRGRNIPFNVICVVSDSNVNYPDELYDFFKGLGCGMVGFSPEERDGFHVSNSLDALLQSKVADFFRRVFVRWREDPDPLAFREARHVLDFVKTEAIGGRYLLDNQMNRPGRIISVAVDGSFSTYSPELISISDQFKYGNILNTDFTAMFHSSALQEHDTQIRSGIQRCKRDCDVFEFCGGGTPSSKYSEHGSFDSSFTDWCRRSRLAVIDGALEALQSGGI